MGRENHRGELGLHREFRGHFGVPPAICSDLWGSCAFPPKTEPKHLLWGLMFLKVYGTEDLFCAKVHITWTTWRKWIWIVVRGIAEQAPHVVS
jgi:hypothetical protein